MVKGQGRPSYEALSRALRVVSGGCRPKPPRGRTFFSPDRRKVWGLYAAFLSLLLGNTAYSQPAPVSWTLELRMAWGGGTARAWNGRVWVSPGSVQQVRDLGVQPWARSYKFIAGDRLALHPAGETGYDACDVSVSASPESVVHVELAPAGGAVQSFHWTIQQLLEGPQVATLDDQGNRLVLRRTPGNHLQVKTDRDHVIFSPGEQWTVQVVPHLLRLEPNGSYRVRMAVRSLGDAAEFWTWQSSVRADGDGELLPLHPEPITVPSDEGVYELVVEVTKRPRWEVPGWRSVPVATRRVQLVVISPTPLAPAAPDWHPLQVVDPASGSSGTWISHLPSLPWLNRRETPRSIAPSASAVLTVAGERMVKLEPGAWQAIGLTVAQPDLPHLVEIEYPGHIPQALAVSVLEPNALGQVAPLTLDGGIYVPWKVVAEPETVKRYRLVFWPKSSQPLLLLANLRKDAPAVFGKIRVLAGPTRLPAGNSRLAEERLAAVYFDRPLFPANFSADAFAGETNRQGYDDWWKFYRGATRLAQYVKYAGFNGAVVCVARDGSLLYPSRHWASTPKYDMGVFHEAAPDPVPKDVVELLARVFDREGLRFVPAIHVSGRIEALEYSAGPNGDRVPVWLQESSGRASQAGYNPLDEKFQQFVQAVVAEIADRYARHPSFAGVALALGPDSHLGFSDGARGLDESTWEKFRKSLGDVPLEERPREPSSALRHAAVMRKWLAWRAEQLAALLARCSEQLLARKRDAQLILVTGEWLENRSAARLLQPSALEPQQVPIAEAALQTGIDATLYRHVPGLVLLRPYKSRMSFRLSEQVVPLATLLSESFDRYFEAHAGQSSRRGVVIYHDRIVSRWPDFDRSSPFGAERTRTELYTHAPPAAAEARRRWIQALAAHDANLVLEGGWLLPLGQEDELRPVLEQYRALPADRFETAQPRSAQRIQPLVVRTLSRADRVYVYALNNSPWPVRASLLIDGPADLELQPLAARPISTLVRNGQQWLWTVELAAYDMVAGWLNSPRARIVDWQTTVPDEVPRQLAERLRQVNLLTNAAVTRPPLPVLENGHFELPASGNAIPGWTAKPDTQSVVRVDADAAGGRQSLYMRSNGEDLWIRSSPFRPPPTGRLYVLARIKTRPGTQPQLRVVLDNDEDFYYPLVIGRDGSVPIPTQWADEFLFPFDNLPVGQLDQIHVGFDLIGEGEVWIDEVQLFDMWIRRDERNALLIASGIAYKNLEQFMNVTDSLHFLESYWPQLLLQYGGAMPSDGAGPPAPRTARNDETGAAAEPSSDSWNPWNPVKEWVPRLPLTWPSRR
ncbi:MAG: hypothetical protein KatS3mg110_0365 [Pirellulaceae bacterium]|nr:MAG: hypothetical protein KatS3mg110_0365 [Pirellulaceae bacterium]